MGLRYEEAAAAGEERRRRERKSRTIGQEPFIYANLIPRSVNAIHMLHHIRRPSPKMIHIVPKVPATTYMYALQSRPTEANASRQRSYDVE